MSTLEWTLSFIGIGYGIFLIYATFVSNRITEAFRLDALISPRPTPQSRWLNLPIGLAALGYYGYGLLKSLNMIGGQ